MSQQTVTVGCKLPNGILMSAVLNGKRVEHKIKGWNGSQIIGSNCGITDGVPKALFDAWLEQYKSHRLVKNGLVFAQSSNKRAVDEAKEKADQKSGKEQLKPSKEDQVTDAKAE